MPLPPTRTALRLALKAACGARPAAAYAGAPTIRPLDAKLEDHDWVSATESESAFMLIDMKKNAVAVTAAGSIAWASPAQATACGGDSRVLLGRRTPNAMAPSFLSPRYSQVAANQYCYGAAVDGPDAAALPSATAGFVGLREVMANGASTAEAAMIGQARNLLLWHRQHQFCGGCGSPTMSAKGGWKRVCASCNALAFPRTDPVVIAAVLSSDGERVLVGRQKAWPQGRFSCLAGFCDPGETLEEAVRREVKEEAGIVVGDDVYYHSSQPWPNGPGGQLMCGFLAIAESEQLRVDTAELEMARWASIAEVATALSPEAAWSTGAGPGDSSTDGERAAVHDGAMSAQGLLLPPPIAIAHSLLLAACELDCGRQ